MGVIAAVASIATGAATGGIGFGTILSTIGSLASTFSSMGGADDGGAGAEQAAAIRASADAQKKVAENQQRALEIQNRQTEVQQRNARVQAVRQSRVARSNILTASGGQDSSSISGGLGSVQSQLAANLGFSNTLSQLESERASFLDQAGRDQQTVIEQEALARAAGIKSQANIMSSTSGGGFGSLISGFGSAISSFSNPRFTNTFRS
jgi:hypothetical protein